MTDVKELPLLGCLHELKIISAAAETITVDGALFTADKVNKNGWGVDSSEADDFALSLQGEPIRYCPDGVPMPGIPAEHACDARDDKASIIGTIDEVYLAGKDKHGRNVYNQRATITASKVIEGLKSGLIKPMWSVFGVARGITKTGMVIKPRGKAATIVSEPAYDEAVFRLAASIDPNLPLYKHGSIAGSKNIGGASTMADEQKNSSQPPAGNTPPGNQQQAGGQDPAKQYAAEIEKLKADNKIMADKIAAQEKAEADIKAKAEAEAKAKTQPATTSLTKEEVEKMITQARADERDQISRQNLANEVAAIKVSAGLLKKEDVEKVTKDLITLSASVLEQQRTEFTEVAKRLGKTPERPFSASFTPVTQPQDTNLNPLAEEMAGKMGIPLEEYKKYTGKPQRSLTTIGVKKA